MAWIVPLSNTAQTDYSDAFDYYSTVDDGDDDDDQKQHGRSIKGLTHWSSVLCLVSRVVCAPLGVLEQMGFVF